MHALCKQGKHRQKNEARVENNESTLKQIRVSVCPLNPNCHWMELNEKGKGKMQKLANSCQLPQLHGRVALKRPIPFHGAGSQSLRLTHLPGITLMAPDSVYFY